MRKVYDLAVKTREYTDRNGNNKAAWDNVGSVMEDDRGGRFIFLKKTFNPAGVPILGNARADSDRIIISMFEPKNNNGNNGGNGNGNNRGGDNYGNNGGNSGFYSNGNSRQQQRQQRRDDDYPMDFASFEENGFNSAPPDMDNEANVPF